MMHLYLQSVGVVAPGITGWPVCRDILTGKSDYKPEPIPRFSPDTLPGNERRRLTSTIRIAMQAAAEAVHASSIPANEIAAVFASSNGDLDITDRICNALTLPERPISPVDFHNSVQNAPAGYWAIGSHCHLPSTSLSAGHACFSAGLLETATQVLSGTNPVLLVAYENTPPKVLARHQAVTVSYAVALLFSLQQDENSLAELVVEPVEQAANRCMRSTTLEAIRLGSPAAQSLLLLELLAREATASCVLPYLDDRGILVEYTPC